MLFEIYGYIDRVLNSIAGLLPNEYHGLALAVLYTVFWVLLMLILLVVAIGPLISTTKYK